MDSSVQLYILSRAAFTISEAIIWTKVFRRPVFKSLSSYTEHFNQDFDVYQKYNLLL